MKSHSKSHRCRKIITKDKAPKKPEKGEKHEAVSDFSGHTLGSLPSAIPDSWKEDFGRAAQNMRRHDPWNANPKPFWKM